MRYLVYLCFQEMKYLVYSCFHLNNRISRSENIIKKNYVVISNSNKKKNLLKPYSNIFNKSNQIKILKQIYLYVQIQLTQNQC